MDTTRPSLLVRLKDNRDAVAWGEFDAIYRPMLHRFARRFGADAPEAEDIVQHCMTAVHEHISSFDYDPEKGRFKSWLRTLVNNRMRNLLRRRRERRAESGDLRELRSPDANPEEVFERIWMDEHLKHCLCLVSADVEERTFRAFQYYVIEERPIEEVCRELEMTPNQVHKSKYRLTKKLSEKMTELLGDQE
ncbi:MAG: sigma-70 family RNA polymerase sigma factor [Phycisphaerae bacterium]